MRTWLELNEAVKDASEEACKTLLTEELKGQSRVRFALRIHSRINYLRAARERQALRAKCKEGR